MALWLVTLIKKLEVEGFIPMWRKKIIVTPVHFYVMSGVYIS